MADPMSMYARGVARHLFEEAQRDPEKLVELLEQAREAGRQEGLRGRAAGDRRAELLGELLAFLEGGRCRDVHLDHGSHTDAEWVAWVCDAERGYPNDDVKIERFDVAVTAASLDELLEETADAIREMDEEAPCAR